MSLDHSITSTYPYSYFYSENLSDLEELELPTAAMNVCDESGDIQKFGNFGDQLDFSSTKSVQR